MRARSVSRALISGGDSPTLAWMSKLQVDLTALLDISSIDMFHVSCMFRSSLVKFKNGQGKT